MAFYTLIAADLIEKASMNRNFDAYNQLCYGYNGFWFVRG